MAARKAFRIRALGRELAEEHGRLEDLLDQGEHLPPSWIGEHTRKVMARLFFKHVEGRDQESDRLEMERMMFESLDAIMLFRMSPKAFRPRRRVRSAEQMVLELAA